MNKWSLETLLKLNPLEFERLLAYLFRKMGYLVEETQYSRDGGIDLLIRLEKFGLSHSWIVQAKRYTGSVGVKEVREYSSLRYRDRVDGVIIVTTSSFTKEAHEEAAEHNVKLIDGNILVEMLNHYMPEAAYSSQGKEASNKTADMESGTILRMGEEKLLNDTVNMGNERFGINITNKNIFLKKELPGIFSKKEHIEHRIELKNLIGMHIEQRYIFLIAGEKNIKVYPLSSKKTERVTEILESLRAEYLRGEQLVLSSRKNSILTILTNKRLSLLDIASEETHDILIKNIVSVETDASLFKKKGIRIIESTNGMRRHSIDVDEPFRWKQEIEQLVRVS